MRLVVLGTDGELLGALEPFEVSLPYWQETGELVARAGEVLGVEVDVLRVLEGDRPIPPGGRVSYLAQVRGGRPDSPRLLPVDEGLVRLVDAREPLRLPYARPGGPAASVGWAQERLGRATQAVQQRTWNLSAIWRLDEADGTPAAWLKQVPPFFGHEAAALRWVSGACPGAVPPLLASGDEGRLLLAPVTGGDLYGAGVEVRTRIVERAQAIHQRSAGAGDDLAAAGVPDLRGPRLAGWIASELAGHVAGHPAAELVAELPSRLAEVDACGLPDVLVHGDLHPGNAIGDDTEFVLLDWGDCFLGHPGFDALRIGVGLAPPEREQLLEPWVRAWKLAAPGCDPRRALDLLGVVEALRSAAVYASFLARIEPAEHPYHRADVPECLDRAVTLARDERQGSLSD